MSTVPSDQPSEPDGTTTVASPAAGEGGLQHLDRVAALCHTANYARRHLEHTVLHQAHLTWTSYDVLHLTVMHRPIDTGVLAGLAHVSKGTVTRAASHLIKRGLLKRSTPDGDRRRAVLTPSLTGWELNQRIRAQLVDELTQLLASPPHPGQTGLVVLRHLITRPDLPPQSGPHRQE